MLNSCCGRVLPWLLLLSTAHPVVRAQNLNPSSDNTQFDPDNADALPDCTVVPYQNGSNVGGVTPGPGMCGTLSGEITFEEIEALALQYAPVVYFHPLDPYTLTDPASMFDDLSAGYFTTVNGKVSDDLNLTALGNNITNPLIWLEVPQTDEYREGDGYEDDGSSKGVVTWSYVDLGDNILAFNYYYFFPYSGQLSMGMTSSNPGDPPFYPFEVQPFGEHEGDWESVSVMVCASAETSQPLAANYYSSEGLYTWTTDCSNGDCYFYKDTNHIVSFTALNHHAMQPYPSRNQFIAVAELSFIGVNGGLQMRDVFAYKDRTGKSYHFMPTESNVQFLNESDPIFIYNGRWGASERGVTITPQLPVNCLADDQLAYKECDPNKFLETLMGLFETVGAQVESFFPSQYAKLILYKSIADRGPLYAIQNTQWVQPSPAMIWAIVPPDSVTEETFCPLIGFREDEITTPPVTPDNGVGNAGENSNPESPNDSSNGGFGSNSSGRLLFLAVFLGIFSMVLMV